MGRVTRGGTHLSADSRGEIARRYGAGEPSTRLAAEYCISATHVQRIASAAGYQMRSHPRRRRLREDAFASVSDAATAYWLGLLMADGCVWKRLLVFGLSASDGEHVAAFRDFLGSTHKISVRPARMTEARNNTEFHVITISCARMVADLASQGMTQGKASRIAPVGVPDTWRRDFWRGVIDGDGSLYFSKRGSPHLSLCGSMGLMLEFQEFIWSLHPNVTARVVAHRGTYRVMIMGAAACAVVQSAYYDGCTPALPRKLALSAGFGAHQKLPK